MKHLRTKMTIALGLAAGYVLGSRAGRQRYERIKSTAAGVWSNPHVQDTVHTAEQAAQQQFRHAAETVRDKVPFGDSSQADPINDVPPPGSTS